MNKNFKILFGGLLLSSIFFVSCKKSYLETQPTSQIASEDLFKTTTSAYTALNGIHSLMNESNKIYSTVALDFGAKAMDMMSDVMGQDMVCTSSPYDWMYYHYSYYVTGYTNYWMNIMPWVFYYRVVNNANNIIDNIDNADGPDAEKNDIKGQALMYRAWAYWNLVQFYQFTYLQNPNAPGVPIYVHATAADNTGNPRGTLQQDFDQMVADCQQGIGLLENATTKSEKSNISLPVAHGIYARIALEMGDWPTARLNAIEAYQDYPLMSTNDYVLGFNTVNNSEWMWGSTLSAEQYNSQSIDCFFSFMDQNCPGYASAGATRSMTTQLYDKMSSTDVRKQLFDAAASKHLQHKFFVKDPTGFAGDELFMRSAEMYLIEAEAEYRMGNAGDAKATLETLVQARDPQYTAPSSGDALLKEIWWQRRIELWGEGFGYRDMKREMQGLSRPTGSGNHSQAVASLLSATKNNPELLMKIPQPEIDANDAMDNSDQNPF